MPYVRSLEILNDCEETQKLMLKMPDWLAAHWNCQVTKALMDGREFPTYKDFTNFVSLEAEIACNPVTSLHALHSSNEKKGAKEFKGNKANVLSTQTAANDNSSDSYWKSKPPCTWCKNDKHQLPKYPDFLEQSLNDKQKHVKENKLCYGCLKPGHNAKECRY